VITCGLAHFVPLTEVAIYDLAAESGIPIPDRLFIVIAIFCPRWPIA